MKKYLPSLDELIPGIITLTIGLLVWSLVGPSLTGLVGKIKAKAS